MNFSPTQKVAILAMFGVIANETYGLDRVALNATTFIPMQDGVQPWQSAWGYKVVSEVGMAAFIADYADDLPPVARFLTPKSVGIKTIGDSYAYSEFELQQWLATKVDLSRDDAETARRKIDEKVDDVLLMGDEGQGVTGLFNNENVTVVESSAGTSGQTDFENKTYKEIVAQFRAVFAAQKNLFKDKKVATKIDSVILPDDAFGYLETTNVSDSIDTSILDSLKAKFPQIVNWYRSELLEDAGANGTGRAVFYRKAKNVLSYVLPEPFRQKNPQEQALHYKVPCYARIGGTVIKNLKGVVYCDGV
ncbi:major capsid family protein [Fibrobacter sp.]|uniref:major capsid family protein n=1 Tax=Fibrobacter sp. TaxID=35828 RepID=UPI003864EF2C